MYSVVTAVRVAEIFYNVPFCLREGGVEGNPSSKSFEKSNAENHGHSTPL
jgi:hypothetical protein